MSVQCASTKTAHDHAFQSSGDAMTPSHLHCAKQQRQTGLQSSVEEEGARGALADKDAGKQAGVPTGGALHLLPDLQHPARHSMIGKLEPGEGGLTEQHTLAAAELSLAAADMPIADAGNEAPLDQPTSLIDGCDLVAAHYQQLHHMSLNTVPSDRSKDRQATILPHGLVSQQCS